MGADEVSTGPVRPGPSIVREGWGPTVSGTATTGADVPVHQHEGAGTDGNAVAVCVTMEGPTHPTSLPCEVPCYYGILTIGDAVPRVATVVVKLTDEQVTNSRI